MLIKYAFACNKILTNGTMDINPHGWRAKWAAVARRPRLYGFNTNRLRAALHSDVMTCSRPAFVAHRPEYTVIPLFINAKSMRAREMPAGRLHSYRSLQLFTVRVLGLYNLSIRTI